VIDNADAIAAAGNLTVSRLPAVFATLDANTEWWSTGPLLRSGRRVSVGDSPLVWQFYPGQGIQLQMLGNWSKANALFQSRKTTQLRDLVDALVPLAADRGGWPAWEYYFRFGTGSPPWTSSISQGTAVQALARAGDRLNDPALLDLAKRALAAFQHSPPAGVRQSSSSGAFYLIYSFAPTLRVLNAHLQATVGLFDLAKITGDPTAQSLFQQGDAETRAVIGRYDTGHWSLYDEKREASLEYHKLQTGFLDNLCKRTTEPFYCDTADRFNAYREQPPSVSPTTRRIRTGRPARLGFSLDKVSRVSVIVTSGDRTVFATSAVVGRGQRSFTWSRPAKAGDYELTVRATDLAGNRSDPATASLRILGR
jgi:hypothetical protein